MLIGTICCFQMCSGIGRNCFGLFRAAIKSVVPIATVTMAQQQHQQQQQQQQWRRWAVSWCTAVHAVSWCIAWHCVHCSAPGRIFARRPAAAWHRFPARLSHSFLPPLSPLIRYVPVSPASIADPCTWDSRNVPTGALDYSCVKCMGEAMT